MLLSLLLFIAQPSFAGPTAVDLKKPYSSTWGDQVASEINDLLPMIMEANDFEVPYMVVYDQESGQVKVVLLGSRTTIDGAKGSVDEFLVIWNRTLKMVQDNHSIALNSTQYEIHYANKSRGENLIVYTNGEYKLP